MDETLDFSGRTWHSIAKGLFMEVRILPVFVWAFTAVLVGTALAYLETGTFVLRNFTLAMVVACLVQAYPTHAANEIVDWLSGTDAQGYGGSKVIREGLLSVKDLKVILLASMSAVILLAFVVVVTIDVRMLWFGVIGILASLSYSLPPFKLGYRPFLGEWVGGFVGVLMAVTGSYYIQAFTLSPLVALAGVALGMSDIAIMELFHTVDYQADKSATPQKRTTIVFLGVGRGKLYVLVHVCGAAFLFWALTLFHWQIITWSVTATVCILLYSTYDPRDTWSIIRSTKKVTWATIVAGLTFAALIYPWFVLLSVPVVLGYGAHRKWGKLPKLKK